MKRTWLYLRLAARRTSPSFLKCSCTILVVFKSKTARVKACLHDWLRGEGENDSMSRGKSINVGVDQLGYQSVVVSMFLLFCPPPFSTTSDARWPRFSINKGFFTFMELGLTRGMNVVSTVSVAIWRSWCYNPMWSLAGGQGGPHLFFLFFLSSCKKIS